MPSPEEVAAARVRLERGGALRPLVDPAAANPWAGPSWIWWTAAALWIVLWPIALGLELSEGAGLLALAFALVAALHMGLLAWPVWAGANRRGAPGLRRRLRPVTGLAEIMALEPDEFEAWTSILFQLMGYEVRDMGNVGDHGVDLQVRGEHVQRGVVQCKRYRGTVGEPVVRDLYGAMAHESADRGWLVTTAAFSRQAHAWADNKPIDLWDGEMLTLLARRYR